MATLIRRKVQLSTRTETHTILSMSSNGEFPYDKCVFLQLMKKKENERKMALLRWSLLSETHL